MQSTLITKAPCRLISAHFDFSEPNDLGEFIYLLIQCLYIFGIIFVVKVDVLH